MKNERKKKVNKRFDVTCYYILFTEYYRCFVLPLISIMCFRNIWHCDCCKKKYKKIKKIINYIFYMFVFFSFLLFVFIFFFSPQYKFHCTFMILILTTHKKFIFLVAICIRCRSLSPTTSKILFYYTQRWWQSRCKLL